jgi:hypothetical protein
LRNIAVGLITKLRGTPKAFDTKPWSKGHEWLK